MCYSARPFGILLWCLQALLALVFAGAGWAKLMGQPEKVELFTAVGLGQWFAVPHRRPGAQRSRTDHGPKTRRIGAALLATVMLGALTAQLFILHVPPKPGVLFLLSGFVVWGRR